MSIPSEPSKRFAGAHGDILSRMDSLKALIDSPPVVATKLIRDKAAGLIVFYRDAVMEHHAEEEQELFREMTQAAREPEDVLLVDSIVKRLTNEHRQLEALWARIEPALDLMAKGKLTDLPERPCLEIVARYHEHARFEEEVVLPLAERLLSSGDMAALDLTLCLRHKLDHLTSYI